MALVGIGLALAFTAISGVSRLESGLTSHHAAMALARSKLDEVLAHPDFKLASDPGEEQYAGVDFGYRLVQRPVELLNPAQRARIPSFEHQLERIEIEVFWGPDNAKQSYVLSSYRMVSANTPPPSSAARP